MTREEYIKKSKEILQNELKMLKIKMDCTMASGVDEVRGKQIWEALKELENE